MTFKAQLAADMANVFMNVNEFAETCPYTVFTTKAVTNIPIILTYSQDLATLSPGQAAMGAAEINKANVADPQRYDSFVFAGVTWRVETIISGDGYQWTLSITTDQRLA